jgi:hypothetical protein
LATLPFETVPDEARCHRRIVSGVTRNDSQRSCGTSLARVAMNARSDQKNLGLATCRRRTASQHQDLCVFGDGVHAVERQGLDDSAEETVEEGVRHGRAGSPLGSCLVKAAIALLDPSGTCEVRRDRSEY